MPRELTPQGGAQTDASPVAGSQAKPAHLDRPQAAHSPKCNPQADAARDGISPADASPSGSRSAGGSNLPHLAVLEAIRLEKKRAEEAGWAPWSVKFWRCMAIAFCVFSIVGHWIEIPYCLFNDWAFGIVDDDSLVFADPMYPFLVYGIAAVLCALLFVPQRDWLIDHYKPKWRAVLRFFIAAVLGSMLIELVMGLMLNQPDPATGAYPLWDNSYLPGNILGRAWIVNDILLGGFVTLYEIGRASCRERV